MSLWWFHVAQDYLQSDILLAHNIYIHPAPKRALGDSKPPCFIKALCGETDAGDYWHQMLRKVMFSKLELIASPSDPGLYHRVHNGWLDSLATTPLDEILGAGHDGFNKESGGLESTFK